MIGEAMPRFDKLSVAFRDNDDFQQSLGFFYSDILEFHGRAYKFFRQRGELGISFAQPSADEASHSPYSLENGIRFSVEFFQPAFPRNS